MIKDMTEGYLANVKALAKDNGKQAEGALKARLDYLEDYADGRADIYVYKDGAPNSFYLLCKGKDNTTWWNGGLLYSGPGLKSTDGSVRLDGSGPAFSVSLTPKPANEHHWSVHT